MYNYKKIILNIHNIKNKTNDFNNHLYNFNNFIIHYNNIINQSIKNDIISYITNNPKKAIYNIYNDFHKKKNYKNTNSNFKGGSININSNINSIKNNIKNNTNFNNFIIYFKKLDFIYIHNPFIYIFFIIIFFIFLFCICKNINLY